MQSKLSKEEWGLNEQTHISIVDTVICLPLIYVPEPKNYKSINYSPMSRRNI